MKNAKLASSQLPAIWFLAVCFFSVFLSPRACFGQSDSAMNLSLDRLSAEHPRVLDELNDKNVAGNPIPLDDPRVPELVKRGWTLAGAWAAQYIEAHPLA